MSDFDEYQQWTRSTAFYSTKSQTEALSYLTLGLNGEAGEVADKLKKVLRDAGGVVDMATRWAVGKELGDVIWYVARLADVLGYDLSDVVEANKIKLASRQERGTLKGSGDDR